MRSVFTRRALRLTCMAGSMTRQLNTRLQKEPRQPEAVVACLAAQRHLRRLTRDLGHGHCQTNLSRPAKGAGPRRSGRQLTPLGQGGGAVLSEDVAAIEVTVLIEVVMERGMDRSELLKGLHVPELRHRPLSSPERLV